MQTLHKEETVFDRSSPFFISLYLFEATHCCPEQWSPPWPYIPSVKKNFDHAPIIYVYLFINYVQALLTLYFSFLHPQGSSCTLHFGDHWSSRGSFTKSHLFKRFQKTSHTEMKAYLTSHLFSRGISISPQFLRRNTDPTKTFPRTHQQTKMMPRTHQY